MLLFIKKTAQCGLSPVEMANLIRGFIEHCIKTGLVDQGLDALATEGVKFMQQPQVKRELIKLIILALF